MSNSIPRNSWLPPVLIGLAVLAAGGCRRCGQEEAVAWVESFSGQVELCPAGEDGCQPAASGSAMRLRDVLRTGAEGQAAVKIAAGGKLQLYPNSRLYFIRRGEEIIAILEAGQARAENLAAAMATGSEAEKALQSAAGSLLVTRTEKGLRTESKQGAEITLRDGSRLKLTGGVDINQRELEEEFQLVLLDGEVEVEAKPGKRQFKMLMGEASLLVMEGGRGKFVKDADGARVQMIIGEAVIEEGGGRQIVRPGAAFDMRVGRVELLRREDLVTVVKEGQRAARLRAAGEKRFRQLRAGERIYPDSDLEVKGPGRVALVERHNRLELLPGTKARFGGAYVEEKKRLGEIELTQGELLIRLRRADGQPVLQKITTPLAELTAEALGLTAQADVQLDNNRLQVVVHTGRVECRVGDRKITVPAGQRLAVGKDGREEGPASLSLPLVVLSPGETAQVFYDRAAPALTFNFTPPQQGAGWLEISTRQDMSQLIISEPLSTVPFGYRLLGPGSYYWRWRAEDKQPPSALVVVKPDPLLAAAKASNVVNEVRDTGIETRIIFQGRAPALRFLWERSGEAKSWLFRLYHGERLERPLLEEKTVAPRLDLAPGKLAEGSYFWYQAGLDEQGRQAQQSQMNKLVLQFDNAALLLRIESPLSGERPSGNRVLIRGLAAEDSRLFANGQPVALDSKWRFEQMLGGVRPGGLLVFHLQKKGLADTYFVRQLGN